MFHIVLFILKIIGIILAAILGLLVLLVCIVLITPLRYEGRGIYEGTWDSLNGKVKFSWLLHLAAGYAKYENKKLAWAFRLGWKKWSSEGPVKEEPVEEGPVIKEKVQSEQTICIEEKEVQQSVERKISQKNTVKQLNTTKKSKKTIGDKIKGLYKKIKYTFQKLCDRIKLLLKRKDMMVGFVNQDTHKKAFKRVKKEGIRLLRFLKPRRLRINAHFGFDDPYITGKILAYLSLVYPFIGKCLNITPDFEQEILDGNILIKGNIRAFSFLIIGCGLLLDKSVRKTYKDIKKIK